MNQTTKEYVESAHSADRLERRIEQLSEAIGLDDTGRFGAKYIEDVVLDSGPLEYTVLPSSMYGYAIIDEIDAGSSYSCGGLSSGPIERLRENGFVIKDITAYTDRDGSVPIPLEDQGDELPDKFIAMYIEYIGAEHPIIEYWNNES